MVTLTNISEVKEMVHEDIIKAKVRQKDKWVDINHFLQDKQKYIIIGTLTGFIIVGSSFGILHYRSNLNTLYHVYVDGKEIGTIHDKSLIHTWETQRLKRAESLYSDRNLVIKNNITYQKKQKYKGKYDDIQVLNALNDTTTIQAKAVEIRVNNKVIGVVNDKPTAELVLRQLKEAYLPQKNKSKLTAASIMKTDANVKVKRIDFKENISLNQVNVDPNTITNEKDMLQLLKKGTLEEKTYIVKDGDTISEIAYRFGLTTEKVFQLNPSLTSDLIHIGDELKVTAVSPLVNVEMEELVKEVQVIPPKVVYKIDNSLYVNEYNILEKGSDGKKEIEYLLHIENGIIVDKKVTKETILSEPTNKIIVRGSKIVPSKGTGVLNWPTVGGVITSYFGPRWGTIHEAIDIAGVKDYTIKAADNGKIIFAGWKSGYGKAVMIDHGNHMVTLYGHLSSIKVSVGDKVAKGQKIGIMGNTGQSTGTHLHFELRIDGVPRNPLNYLGV